MGHWLCAVISGVLQGCPLSGFLFVRSIDPLVHLFQNKIEDRALGAVRACADDIGASLKALYYLPILHTAFEEFQNVSGLTLKPQNCAIILTSLIASPGNCAAVANWLTEHCPDWASMQITNAGKDLGFQLG